MFWRENKDEDIDQQAPGYRQPGDSGREGMAPNEEFTQHGGDFYGDVPGSNLDQPPSPPPQIGTRGAASAEAGGDTSVIAANTHWSGTLVSSGPVRVQGTVDGEISSESDIYVAEGASVQATLQATNVTIAGSVNGEVTCTGRFEMLASGHLEGNVTAPTFVVHEGASVAGGLRMRSDSGTSAAEPARSEEER